MNKTALTISLAIILALTACQKSTKIGLSIGDFSSDRISQEPVIFEQEVTSLGGTLMTEYAYGDPTKQVEQARSLIQSGIDVLVIFPTASDHWEDVVEEAHKAGVKVIAYERMLNNTDVDYYFSFFNEAVGKQQAQYVVEHRPSGNYILLGGPVTDNNSLLFMKGQKDILQPYVERGEINILLEKHLDTWNSIDAYNELVSFMESNDTVIDAILAANDDLAGGCIMAMEMTGKNIDMLITGQDATLTGCRNILAGKQSMTVYKSISNLARESARAAVTLAKGRKIKKTNATVNNGRKDVPAMLLETTVVDKDNINETVVADGFIKAEELNATQ